CGARRPGSNPGFGPINHRGLLPLSLTMVDARFHMFKDEDFWMLAEIESHPDVMRWNIEPYKGDKAEMYRALKKPLKGFKLRRIKYFLLEYLKAELLVLSECVPKMKA
ncbi:MAG: hypothetical protein QXR79_04810, partial [Candidatus Bathyarchaeia archaeon]